MSGGSYSYEDQIDIDPDCLDQHWEEQPALMMSVSETEADARRELSEAKHELAKERADAELAIRGDAIWYLKEHKLPKDTRMTEGVVLAMVEMDEHVQRCQKDAIAAQHALNMCAAAVRAVQDRKTALENLVRLHGMSYYSAPRENITPKNRRNSTQEHTNGKLQRKKRSKS